MKTELIEDRATKVARAFADSGSFDPINREALVRDMALELVVFARAELAAICEENARLETEIECIMADMPMAKRLVNQRHSIDFLQQKNARLREACCDVRLSLGQSFESMGKRDLLAIIGEAERIIEAALSGEPSGKVLVDRRTLEWVRDNILPGYQWADSQLGNESEEARGLSLVLDWLRVLLKEGEEG